MMKLSQKKACGSCRALTSGSWCELGYRVQQKYVLGVPVTAKPLEPCPKPLTVDDFIAALNDWKKGRLA